MSKKLSTFHPVTLTGETIDFILREYGSDALSLYVAYVGISQWQETNQIYASESFMMQRMQWGKDKFRKNKKLLVDGGFVETIKKVDKRNRVLRWLIKVHYLVQLQTSDFQTSDNPPGGSSRRVDNPTTSALEETKCFRRNKSALEERSNNKKKQEKKELQNLPQEPSPETYSEDELQENFTETLPTTETSPTYPNQNSLSLQGSQEKELQDQDSSSPRSCSLGSQSGRDAHKKKKWLKELAEGERPEDLLNLCATLNRTDEEIKQSAWKALDWLDSNGKRKKDYRAFLRNWVRREYPDRNKNVHKGQNMKSHDLSVVGKSEGKGLM